LPRSSKRKTPPVAKPPASLLRAQRWFLDEIVGPHQLPLKSRAASRPTAGKVVLPSKTLTAQERVAIYSRMYFARLHDVLADDFPTIFSFLEPREFQRLVRQYLTKHPSKHYSLAELGSAMPAFLSGPVRVRRRALLRDVARVEMAMSRIFDAAEVPVLSAEDFARLPPQDWQRARIRTIQAVELLELDHAVNPMITAVRSEQPLPEVRRQRSWVVVYRKKYAVWRWDLSGPQFVLLRALLDGKTMLEAIGAAAQIWRGGDEELETGIFRWFQEFVYEEIFSAVEDVELPRRKGRGKLVPQAPEATGERHVITEFRLRQVSEAASPKGKA
jgi:hypothetical protein